jgi:hypothetical protein
MSVRVPISLAAFSFKGHRVDDGEEEKIDRETSDGIDEKSGCP